MPYIQWKQLCIAALFYLLLHGLPVEAQGDGKVREPWLFTEARQFDFWIGEWDVNLRIKQEDSSWADRVKSKANIYRILDGKAILELWNADTIKGYSLRYFDSEKKKWILMLNWPGKNRSGSSSLSGMFRHGRGEFFSTRKNQAGQEVISRYTFSDITATSLRWDDAFSSDGGKTWTNNWIMEFSRSADQSEWPAPGRNLHTYENGARCDLAEFRVFEQLIGTWHGEMRLESQDGNSAIVPVELNGYKVLDGCAVMNFMSFRVDGKNHREFSLKTYNTYGRIFEDTRLDNSRDGTVSIYYGKQNGQTYEFVESEEYAGGDIYTKYVWTFEKTDQAGFEMYRSTDKKATWKKMKAATFIKSDE